ncbi:hypothetical protein G5714_004154 [Onychostoma macrolepis]|uniref:Uncharacterized protein n=1 Tax=Onychostoma macrolepis TaxID=369639 RepID=A0A7J6DCB5_9TELE|nr:hypothetical protein G5714_004154 [Onychostoma macrolepis]
MPRRVRDHSNTPSSSLSRERSLPRKETASRSSAPVHPPPTTQVSVCSERPSSVSFNVAVGRRIKLSPPTTCSFVTRGSRDRRHFRFSPTAFGHRGLHHPNQGHHRLSFVVDDITPSRPSRHPNSGLRQLFNRTGWFLCLLCRPHDVVELYLHARPRPHWKIESRNCRHSGWRGVERTDGIQGMKLYSLVRKVSRRVVNRCIHQAWAWIKLYISREQDQEEKV